MTKKELIKALENYPDDDNIIVWSHCDKCETEICDNIVSVCANEFDIQLNTEGAVEETKKFEEELINMSFGKYDTKNKKGLN